MRKSHSKVAATLAGLAMISGVSVAMAESAFADGGRLTHFQPRVYKTYRGCLTAGNKAAQQGKLITFRCVARPHGYALIVTR